MSNMRGWKKFNSTKLSPEFSLGMNFKCNENIRGIRIVSLFFSGAVAESDRTVGKRARISLTIPEIREYVIIRVFSKNSRPFHHFELLPRASIERTSLAHNSVTNCNGNSSRADKEKDKEKLTQTHVQRTFRQLLALAYPA